MSSQATFRRIQSGEAGGPAAGLARGVLSILSIPYAAASSTYEFFASSSSGAAVGVPVLSVGNITAGGTGKTPLVAHLVAQLIEKGRRPVVLSRGYAAEEGEPNDEALVLARRFPGVLHLQGKDRATLAQHADDARLGDVLVLDDGFQHHGLARDLNICCVDATNPFGYGHVLPRGMLREPISGLYRARPVVITRAELVSEERLDEVEREILAVNELARVVATRMALTTLHAVADGSIAENGSPASGLSGKRVALGSGVGNPTSFEKNVRLTGARVVCHAERGDHHAWTEEDAAALAKQAQAASAECVVVTMKDAVKLARLPWPADAPPLQAVDVEVQFVRGEDLWNKLLDEALKG